MKLNDGNEPEIESDSESKPTKRFKADPALFAVPTTEEAYALKNTEILYQSNLLKLQLDELLSELAIPEAKQKRFEAIINDLKSSLKNLKPIKNIKYSDFEVFDSHKFQIPLKELCKTVFKDGTYNFTPPRDTFLLGSFLSQTQIYRSSTEVSSSCDLAFEMDAEFFNERDYLNYRYFIKKSLYMAQVYAQLSAVKKYANAQVKFEFLAEYSSPYNPTLCMTFLSDGFEVRFHPLPASSSFKAARFSPEQANVRKEFFLKNLDPNGDLADLKSEEDEDELTPRYNSQLLADIVARENNAYIKKAFNESKSVYDAVKLLKLWLFKRGLNKGSNSFDNFTLSMFVAHLMNTRQINPLMSRYQIFRIVLLNLSKSEWHKRGLRNKSDSGGIDLATFHRHFPVVFVDSTGYLNLTAGLNKFTYLKLKHDAEKSLNLLNDESSDNFEDLFIKNHYFSAYFDSLIKIDPGNHVKFYNDIVKKDKSRLGKMIDLFNCSYELTSTSILNLIQRALETKTALIYSDHIEKLRWSVNTSPKLSVMETPSILIGLIFGEKYDLELIRGPESTHADAAEFRKFWGPKSELRRFKDASICEAVYFEARTVAKKRIIYSEIIKHILNFHLSINEDHIKFVDNRRLNKLLGLPAGITENEYGTGEERLADLGNKLDEFSRILTNLKDLPLSISSVYGLTSALRRTDPFPPLAHYFKYSKQSERALYATKRGSASSSSKKKSSRNSQGAEQIRLLPKSEPLAPVAVPFLKPLEVCIHLESSGHWPDDLACIARLKAAFHLKIVQLLRQAYGVAGEAKCDYFDVFFKGCLFRVRVCTSSELMLIKTRLNEQNVRVTRETPRSLAYEKLMFDMAKLSGFIQAFEKKYDCYSGVCRLAKRWLSSHFLLEYFEEEAIDLICAYLFSHPSSYDPPKSIVTGFLRFLELMANFDWKNQALIIDPDNEIKKEELLDAKLRFQESRPNLAPVYIITHFDVKKPNSVFTREKPTIQNLCRTVLQAKNSLNSLKTSIQNFDSNENFKGIFKPNVSYYDLVIKLKPNYCSKAYQSVDLTEGVFLPHYRNLESNETSNSSCFPVVDFDAARSYVNELRESYGDIALFFYDLYGCTQVYVLFKPDATKPKEAKIANAKHSMINSSSGKLELNLEAVIDDFKIIGSEFVQDVVILNQKIFQ